ncbi:TFIIA-alpha and beta-like factor [Solea senegalensis]|uniref:TFIIA-alpha and beta-like factor n=1 Tax=Solea senegalensis TaxID=28829 RepID=A0AAV6S4B7_SOLSE|nr:TFIIA-alpha and beta-like factor isoform X2 [Solea senegalensis]KAG7511640.1 TFIIA-alpha and beta-like factor [Solea senegalensis]
MRELFLEEGLEDRVLDDLRHLWESKMMQSKAMEDFRKNNINSSNFVLQLPDNYGLTEPEPASLVIPASQNIHRFPVKNTSETVATFSLPAGLAYPVQIPAGVTLQTASGQLYKVNVPVVVTQAPVGQQPVSHPTQKAPAPPSATVPSSTVHRQQVEPVSAACIPQLPLPETTSSKEINLPQQQQQQQVPAADSSHLQEVHSPPSEVTTGENNLSAQPEPVNFSSTASPSPCSQELDFQLSTEEKALPQTALLKTKDIDDILKEVIEEEREKAQRDLDYSYSELSDIVQLDGAADNSDMEEEDVVPLEENDFLGMINAEAIKVLQDGDGSSDGNSISSSDSEGADKPVEEEVTM